MRIGVPRAIQLAVVMGFGLVSAMFGQCSSSVDAPCFGITSAGPTNNNLAGVYTDPYQAIGGNAVLAFCDDYFDEVNPPENWNALVTNLSAFSDSNTSPVSTVYYGSTGTGPAAVTAQTTDYIAASILAVESLAIGDSTSADDTEQNQLSYALWGVFDPAVLGSTTPLDSNDLAAATNDLANALTLAASYSSGQALETALGGAVINIYTPTLDGSTPQPEGTLAPGESSRPQEFISVSGVTTGNALSLPEPSSWAMLAVDFIGVGIVALVFRRRQVRRHS